MEKYTLYSFSEFETVKLAGLLARFSRKSCNVYLYGDIGLGKTSFCRGFLRSLGYSGCVKSPSYVFVESYTLNPLIVHHFDFYRIRSFEEIEYIGIRDYFNNFALCLVEWPNIGFGILPKEDIAVSLEYYQDSLVRKITLESFTSLGKVILKRLFDHGSIAYVKNKV